MTTTNTTPTPTTILTTTDTTKPTKPKKEILAPVDLAMIGLLRAGVLSAYTVVPPLFTAYCFGDERDSDIDDVVLEHDVEPGWSENLKASTRLYVGRDA